MRNKKYHIELLDIVDLIHTDYCNKWPMILKKVAKIFDAEDAFFASKENDNLICISSSDLYKNYKIENNTAAYITIKHQKTLSIENYNNFSGRSPYWVKKGIKSILSVPVFYGQEIFGALQIAYFSRFVNFEQDDIFLLEKIAKIISFVFHNIKNKERYDKTIDIELKQIESIYNNEIPKSYKDLKFTEWIKSYLNKVLKMTSAQAIGFVFPQEDIYVAIPKNGSDKGIFSYTKTKEVKDLITYKMWEKQISDIMLLEDFENTDIDMSNFSKIYNIKSALFVPVEINKKVVAVFAFGFDSLDTATKDYRIFLQTIAMHIMFAIETSKNLSRVSSILSETEEKFIESFVLMMEARDTYTKGHSQRVAFYTKKIAQTIQLNEDDQSMLYAAGIVHDIGKIGIPDAVLLKPGKLTDEEYKIIQYHPEFSYQIIKDINRFKEVAESVRYHHERCDGSGYPKGLKKDEIPLGAKIMAIADIFDAITTNRPYRKAMSIEEAIETMKKMKNQLDSTILNAALPTLRESFIYEDMNEHYRNFMPGHIDKIRMEIFTKDYMTGLLRRRTFIKNVEKMIKNNKRFTMFYVDIKDLSRINYKYSMDVGDRVILCTAEILKKIRGIKFLSRTQPDVFYFIYIREIQAEIFALNLKNELKGGVVNRLSKEEIEINSWGNIVDFYISFSEFLPGKNAEDMMYECQRRKKEMEDFINGK